MKLARRIGLAFVVGVWLVLGVFAYARWQREARLFDSDMRRDHRILAVTLAPAVTQAWDEEGEAVATALLRRVDAARDAVSIRWVSLAPDAPRELRPALSATTIEGVKQGALVQVLTEEDGRLEAYLFTYVNAPLRDEGPGALEISETMTHKASYLIASLWNVLLQSLVVAIVSALLAMAIGAYFVGRPVEALRQAARRLGVGEAPTIRILSNDELAELGRELEAAGERLQREQQRAMQALEARLELVEHLRHAERLTTVGRLASALAHELGTPLNVISGHAQLIAKGRVDGKQARDGASIIVEQCARMTALVRKVLDYARRKSPRRTLTDLAVVLREVGELLGPLAHGRSVELRVDASFSAPLEADADQIQQVVINLVVNAIQACEPGASVVVALTREQVRRSTATSAGAERHWFVVTVTDQGSGIPPEDLERVFEPFFTTKPSGEGTGLGLSIAQDIVTEHGGWLAVDSEVGRGSRFQIFLPVLSQ